MRRPGAVEHLEDGPVPAGDGVVAHDRVEQGAHLGLGQRLGQALGHPGHLDLGRRVGREEALVGEEPVQRPHRHQRPGHRRRRPDPGRAATPT